MLDISMTCSITQIILIFPNFVDAPNILTVPYNLSRNMAAWSSSDCNASRNISSNEPRTGAKWQVDREPRSSHRSCSISLFLLTDLDTVYLSKIVNTIPNYI
jgi:hypothetical protein